MSGNRKTWNDAVRITQEDQLLRELVQELGDFNWGLIAKKIEFCMNVFRTGKQCRERWHNHLDPKINKES